MKSIVIATTALVLFASGTASLAFSNEVPDSQPQVKTHEGIKYVSGGFGVDERENLRAMSKDDNLELSFALQNKDYLGGAKVLIKDGNGKDVVKTFSDGPLFFAKLPQGTYAVEATAMGQTQEQIAHVPSNRQAQLYFAWRESKEQPQMNTLARK
jgi:hypothetical protein